LISHTAPRTIFITMANEVHRLGYITDDDTYHFTHMDLYPHNILVNLHPNSVAITGVLDWDDALFVPSYVACRAPFWLWEGERGVNEQDEYEALREPETAELKKLKKLFEGMIDEKYLIYAYDTVYKLLRRMFAVMQVGIFTNELGRECEAITKEWANMKGDFDKRESGER
jgi:Ser/Thr protein kinase RdoA (MazF antagonist)